MVGRLWFEGMVAALLVFSAAPPLAAQVRVVTTTDGRTVYVVPAAPGDTRTKSQPVRTVVTPDGRTVHVVQEQPKDIRTPRQQCVDEEVAAEGGAPSQLAMGAIDLKCSQR